MQLVWRFPTIMKSITQKHFRFIYSVSVYYSKCVLISIKVLRVTQIKVSAISNK